uniref:putative CENPB DNA-binding domain-containing protein 1 n=1 Tax=Myxine glutinosa TaxID=7769 RepID=UPI00358EA035
MSAKRPVSGGVVSTSKRARKTINFEVKMDVLRRFDAGQRAVDIGKVLGLPATTVRSIRTNADKIRECVQSVTPLSAVRITKRRDKVMNHMERSLSLWIEDQGRQNAPVTLTRIQEKAKSLFQDLKKEHAESSTMENFSASRGWFQRFTRRCDLRNVHVTAESVAADYEAAKERAECAAEEGEHRHSQRDLNGEQTCSYWTRMPSRTCVSREHRGTPEDHVTLDIGDDTDLLGHQS